MSVSSIAARARVAAPRILAWAKRRAAERSTWIGLGLAASSLGYSTVGQHLTSLADAIPMILGVGGAAIAAASTSSRP